MFEKPNKPPSSFWQGAEEKRRYDRDVSIRKRRARHSGWRDPHMFTVIKKDSVEFWYGIHGPNGDHRRFVVPFNVAYSFFKRHTAKLERIFSLRKQPLPEVPLDDIDEYVSEALQGLPVADDAERGEVNDRNAGQGNEGNASAAEGGGTAAPEGGTGKVG